jgi:hypothetical protein
MPWPEPYPDLQGDERTTLTQHLDHWREGILVRLQDLTFDEATRRPLEATNLTVAGIVRHLAFVEDRWFHYRLAGNDLPEPWASADQAETDWSFNLRAEYSTAGVAELYRAACGRSRAVTDALALDDTAPVPSFGDLPVTLRWVLVHLLAETSCHTGHVELLRDSILAARSG